MEGELTFENIDVSHMRIIGEAVAALGFKSCQLSAGLYCWAKKYETEICVSGGFIYIKQKRRTGMVSPRGICYFLPMPVRDGTSGVRELKGALEALISHHRRYEEGAVEIWGVADDMLAYGAEALALAGMREQLPDRDWAEYIHTPENLIDMKGKRFHAKKNAVNQFIRNNSDFQYLPLDSETIPEAASLQSRLLAGIQKFEPDKETVRSLCVENTAIMRAFGNFEALSLSGGIIRVDGEACAYALGGKIGPETFGIFFEKGVRSYNGIFQVLEQEMLKKNVLGYRFINREEDLGQKGLRFAKERLRPDVLLFKRSFVEDSAI